MPYTYMILHVHVKACHFVFVVGGPCLVWIVFGDRPIIMGTYETIWNEPNG
jgi:hypothetical protein